MHKELEKRDGNTETETKILKIGTDINYRHEYVPKLVIFTCLLHFFGIWGGYYFLFKVKWYTFVWAFITGFFSGMGVVLGSHRHYSHKSYKATIPFQLFLVFCHTLSGQNHIYWWARDHRLHHKFSDTDADPYNASRGFFFAHSKWLMTKKHPLVLEKGKTIDVSDLEQDKLVMFQKKYLLPLHILIAFAFPTLIPVYFWNENFWTSVLVNYFFRYLCILHQTSSVNSFAHMYGVRSIDKRIKPTQSIIADWLTMGDGWHNYHHTFPSDPCVSEFGYTKGYSTRLLEFCEFLGLVYDLKRTSVAVVLGHARRHGDGSLVTDDLQSTAKKF